MNIYLSIFTRSEALYKSQFIDIRIDSIALAKISVSI